MSCQEYRTTVEGFLKEPSYVPVTFVSSAPSTIHTSFLLNQVIETEERFGRPQETVVFQNTDPRFEKEEENNTVKGAEFLILRLKTGIFVCGPNAEYDFSLIKNKIEELYHYQSIHHETQFRSRDIYARICAHLMDEMEDELELEEGPSDIIPELRGYFVGHIDCYGNIKTTITRESLKGKYESDDIITITINNVKRKARFVNGLFSGKLGELIIYPGSSGSKDNPYLEISVWTHFKDKDYMTGEYFFNKPKVGSDIHLV